MSQPHKAVGLKIAWLVGLLISGACQAPPELEGSFLATETAPSGPVLTESELATLESLAQVDDYPLYTMVFQGEYSSSPLPGSSPVDQDPHRNWACALFAVLGDRQNMLYGRNFDWDFSPGLLLFTDPPDGYASAAMVDIAYLGFGGNLAYDILELPLADRARLLEAPYLPFDGMNETGLVVGMAAVPSGSREFDPAKETIDSLMVIRKILDQAATIEEALVIFNAYNIDMGSGPTLHYLIADGSGSSALVEFSGGEMVVIPNHQTWQAATNFLASEAGDYPEKSCWRYQAISERLSLSSETVDFSQARGILETISQPTTQWSVVYGISTGEIELVMGGNFEQVHGFVLGGSK